MKKSYKHKISMNFFALLLIYSLFFGLGKSAGHISSIQTNVDYINYEHAKTFEFLFELEHDLPTTGCMKIRLPFLIDDGTSNLFFLRNFLNIFYRCGNWNENLLENPK